MSQTEAKRAVAYVRVSSLSQVDGHSLDAQERLFGELCKNRGWTPVRIYREEGKSAHSESIKKRPALRQLLSDAPNGEFDVAVVHTLDRWARNQRVMLESIATLAQHNVALVSITENIDYSNPQGMLFTQMLGSFAQYFSDSLGTHVSKGLGQRAAEGRHTGGLPFGYESCWEEKNGERKRRCKTEHPGGVHPVEAEAEAVRELFKRYAADATTLSRAASWMNEQGFRTRNTKKLPDGKGNLVAGPRRFTTSSVRGILHNPFYAGMVKHRGELYPGAHEPLVTRETFDLVEANLQRNSGRWRTVESRPEREYLLKGIIRCAHCRMPMWAQTYNSGRRYYREHRGSRSLADCPSAGGSINCDTADEQVGDVIEAIELGPKWEEEVLSIISVSDEVERVKEKRQKTNDRLKRLGRAFVDGLYDENEYRRQKRLMEMELESLVVPQADAAEEAGRLIERLPELWSGANMEERRRLLLTMLDAVYVDAKEERRIVAIKPKAPFRPIFQVATTREGSGIHLVKEADLLDNNENGSDGVISHPTHNTAVPCSWWRRGRVELPVQKTPRSGYPTGLAGS